ncbi:MAG: ATPase [Planctomycetaceae bacterium]|nr:ATPase [Planctomycetaceae bacterium]
MHVLFVSPDTGSYNHQFLRGLRELGARVTGVGLAPRERLSEKVRPLLDHYVACERLLDGEALTTAVRALPDVATIERVETIDEPLVETAAHVREKLGLPGLSVATARLCRDKVAMKAFLRERGIPCANSASVGSEAELREFAEREGYPLIVKPIAGFNSLDTWKVDDAARLTELLPRLGLKDKKRVAVEEFIDGHEGFYDTLIGPEGVRHDFVGHYFPGCLEANRTRWISPQIAITNRVELGSYAELRETGRRVVDALGLRSTATHMEWFFGPKGLKFSEIGARPAGERIWEMYSRGNDFDVFREWALAVFGRPSEAKPSRRLAVGSIQIRPDRDGKFLSHTGVEQAFQKLGSSIYEHSVPAVGSPTSALDRGWLCNTWFRLSQADFDELRRSMTFLGDTVKSRAK